MKKQVIKEVIFIIAMTILAVLTLYTIKKNEINTSICFFGGGVYVFLFFMIKDYITADKQPEPEQENEIMYFEKTSELQEWTEKLKKEEVEVIYYGTVWNALVKHRDMITQDKVNNYCIIYKYN
jgi:hypothetical protein